jgi:hypothetical protein
MNEDLSQEFKDRFVEDEGVELPLAKADVDEVVNYEKQEHIARRFGGEQD